MMFHGHLIAFSLWLSVSLGIIVLIADANTNVTNIDSVLIATSIKSNTSTSSTSDQSRYFLSHIKDNDRIVFDRPSFIENNKRTTTFKPVLNNDDVTRTVNVTGEYMFSVKLKDGTRRVETGEYEYRNGQRVFIIRGYFGQVTGSNGYQLTVYVYDHTGYHEIPFSTDPSGIIDFRPETPGSECDLSAGNYCIDQKLLAILVG